MIVMPCILFVHTPQVDVAFVLNINIFLNAQSKEGISISSEWIITKKALGFSLCTLEGKHKKNSIRACTESRHESALQKLMCHPLRCGYSGSWCENTGCRYWDRKWQASKFQSLMSMSVFKVMRNFWLEYTSELWLALSLWHEK